MGGAPRIKSTFGFIVVTFLFSVSEAQLQEEEDKGAAKCNTGMCLQATNDAAQILALGDGTIKFMQFFYDNKTQSAFSAAIYNGGTEIPLRNRCKPQKRHNKNETELCLENLFFNRFDPGNNLFTCFDLYCTFDSYYKHKEPKKFYDIYVVANSISAQPNHTIARADQCKIKGINLFCIYVGTDDIAITYYENLCDYFKQVGSYNEVATALKLFQNHYCTPKPAAPRVECKSIPMVGDLMYVPHETACDAYIECKIEEGSTKVISSVKTCPCAKFWDQGRHRCVSANTFSCATDPCRGSSDVLTHKFMNNPRAHWVCENRRSTRTLCCEGGKIYDDNIQTCVTPKNDTTYPPCICDKVTSPPPPTLKPLAPDCDKREIAGLPGYFIQKDNGKDKRRMCAPGTAFVQDSCRCDATVDFVDGDYDAGCPKIDFHVVYADTSIDDIVNEGHVKNHGVTVVGDTGAPNGDGYGIYAGTDYLKVPRFKNYDWMGPFALAVTFNADEATTSDEPLMSNGGCGGSQASVEIRLTTDSEGKPAVKFDVLLEDGNLISLSLLYVPQKRTSAYLSFKAATVTAKVTDQDGQSLYSTAPTNGENVKFRNCPLYIGHRYGSSFYKGIMYENKVFTDCVPPSYLKPNTAR